MARVGYLEGTDPLLLSSLTAEGIETLPVANTWDGHGKPINQLGKGEVNLVVGYLHKVIPTEQAVLQCSNSCWITYWLPARLMAYLSCSSRQQNYATKPRNF